MACRDDCSAGAANGSFCLLIKTDLSFLITAEFCLLIYFKEQSAES